MTILYALAVGFFGYRMDKPIKKWFVGDNDVSELASWTFGGLLILIGYIIISTEFMTTQERGKAIMALCGSLVGVGAGVTLAKVSGVWK